MRRLLVLLVCMASLIWSSGCGERRPDPRANPDFDEAGYHDPSVGVQSLVDEAAAEGSSR